MARGSGCSKNDRPALARGNGELVLAVDVPYGQLPNAGDETLNWYLRDIGLDPAETRYRLIEAPLATFTQGFCDAEAYLLDGDEDGYRLTVELADVLEAGGELDPAVVCDYETYYSRTGLMLTPPSKRQLMVFDGCHRLSAHALAGRERARAYELQLP